MHKLICFCIILIFTACSGGQNKSPIQQTAEVLLRQPNPTPEYLAAISRSGTYECLDLIPLVLWEKGFEAGVLPAYLASNLYFIIDEIRVGDDKTIVLWKGSPMPILNEDYKVIGTVSGGVDACFEMEGLDFGVHMAEVRFTTMLGTEYSYSWAFEFTEADLEYVSPTIFTFPTTPPE